MLKITIIIAYQSSMFKIINKIVKIILLIYKKNVFYNNVFFNFDYQNYVTILKINKKK
jgi:hypothetical protein